LATTRAVDPDERRDARSIKALTRGRSRAFLPRPSREGNKNNSRHDRRATNRTGVMRREITQPDDPGSDRAREESYARSLANALFRRGFFTTP